MDYRSPELGRSYNVDPSSSINTWYSEMIARLIQGNLPGSIYTSDKPPQSPIDSNLDSSKYPLGEPISIVFYPDEIFDVFFENSDLSDAHEDDSRELPIFRRKVRFSSDGAAVLVDSLQVYSSRDTFSYEIRRIVNYPEDEPEEISYDLIILDSEEDSSLRTPENFRPGFIRRYWITSNGLLGELNIFDTDRHLWTKLPGEHPPLEDNIELIEWLFRYGTSLDSIPIIPSELFYTVRDIKGF